MSLIRIDSYNQTLNLGDVKSDTVEWFISNAYNKSFYFYKHGIPEFFDVFDIFLDDVNDSSRKFLTSEIYGFTQSRDEISMEFVQDLLIKMKIEFISIEGEHLGCCQNILFTDWWDE